MTASGRLGGSPCLVTQNDLGQRLALVGIQQRQRCVALPENEHWDGSHLLAPNIRRPPFAHSISSVNTVKVSRNDFRKAGMSGPLKLGLRSEMRFLIDYQEIHKCLKNQ